MSLPRCCVISAKAAATISVRCCGGWAATPVRRSTAPSRARCRASAPIHRREQALDLAGLLETLTPAKPVVPVVFYRSMLLAADVAPIDALYRALAARGLAPAPLFVTSLKDA